MCLFPPFFFVPSKRWVIVTQDVRASPPSLRSPYGVGTWKVDTMGKAFRFVRLRTTGNNGRSVCQPPSCMCVCIILQCVYVRVIFQCVNVCVMVQCVDVRIFLRCVVRAAVYTECIMSALFHISPFPPSTPSLATLALPSRGDGTTHNIIPFHYFINSQPLFCGHRHPDSFHQPLLTVRHPLLTLRPPSRAML